MKRILLASLALLLGSPVSAHADDAIELIDKTRIIGKLVHFYEGLLTVKLANGTELQLPSSKVARITFKLPKPRPELSTPQKTFDRMKKAALEGNLETYVDCHSTYYQMFLGHQAMVATPQKFKDRLKKEWGNVQLEIVSTEVKGEVAMMKVKRVKGEDREEGEVHFVKENGEWKMILPL
jgi:hypothetical protein